jgi:hypothetical protein
MLSFEEKYYELEKRYEDIKHWLYRYHHMEIPISIDPYTQDEYKRRQNTPEHLWHKRDKEAIKLEKRGEATWL